LIGKLAGANASIIGKGIAGEAIVNAAKARNKGDGVGSKKEYEFAVKTYLPAIKVQFPNLPLDQQEAKAYEKYQQNKAAGLPGAESSLESREYLKEMEEVGSEFRADMTNLRKKHRNPDGSKKEDDEIKEIMLAEKRAARRKSKLAGSSTAPAAPAASGTVANPLPMVANQNQAVTGKFYNTPRGVARWDGKQFVQD